MIVMTGRTRKSVFSKSLRSSMFAPALASIDMLVSSFSSKVECLESVTGHQNDRINTEWYAAIDIHSSTSAILR